MEKTIIVFASGQKEAGNIIGIPLIDHVIIGGCEYVSLHEKELL